MMQKVGNVYSLWNMLNGNLALELTDKMQNSDAEYYLQVSALKSGVCDCKNGQHYASLIMITTGTHT